MSDDSSVEPALLARQRIRLDVGYDGAPFAGWQVQDNAPTVQAELEAAIRRVCGLKPDDPAAPRVTGSGRTDAGVHAVGQVAHVDVASSIRPERWSHALNATLPPQIRVSASSLVPDTFHARFSVTGKTYRYHLSEGPADPLTASWVLPVHLPFDFDAAATAAAAIPGERDFSRFEKAGAPRKDGSVRTITSARLYREEGLWRPRWIFEVSANGFLYGMVRLLVGGLLRVGHGSMTVDAWREALADPTAPVAGWKAVSAPAHGLCLWRVQY
jgi:tRNA pseudouridine38-40 synthase